MTDVKWQPRNPDEIQISNLEYSTQYGDTIHALAQALSQFPSAPKKANGEPDVEKICMELRAINEEEVPGLDVHADEKCTSAEITSDHAVYHLGLGDSSETYKSVQLELPSWAKEDLNGCDANNVVTAIMEGVSFTAATVATSTGIPTVPTAPATPRSTPGNSAQSSFTAIPKDQPVPDKESGKGKVNLFGEMPNLRKPKQAQIKNDRNPRDENSNPHSVRGDAASKTREGFTLRESHTRSERPEKESSGFAARSRGGLFDQASSKENTGERNSTQHSVRDTNSNLASRSVRDGASPSSHRVRENAASPNTTTSEGDTTVTWSYDPNYGAQEKGGEDAASKTREGFTLRESHTRSERPEKESSGFAARSKGDNERGSLPKNTSSVSSNTIVAQGNTTIEVAYTEPADKIRGPLNKSEIAAAQEFIEVCKLAQAQANKRGPAGTIAELDPNNIVHLQVVNDLIERGVIAKVEGRYENGKPIPARSLGELKTEVTVNRGTYLFYFSGLPKQDELTTLIAHYDTENPQNAVASATPEAPESDSPWGAQNPEWGSTAPTDSSNPWGLTPEALATQNTSHEPNSEEIKVSANTREFLTKELGNGAAGILGMMDDGLSSEMSSEMQAALGKSQVPGTTSATASTTEEKKK